MLAQYKADCIKIHPQIEDTSLIRTLSTGSKDTSLSSGHSMKYLLTGGKGRWKEGQAGATESGDRQTALETTNRNHGTFLFGDG